MAYKKMNIKELSQKFNVEISEISKFLVAEKILSSTHARNPEYKVDYYIFSKVKAEFEPESDIEPEGENEELNDEDIMVDDSLPVKSDKLLDPSKWDYRNMNHNIFIHQAVLDEKITQEQIRKRLAFSIQQLGAYGWTSITKGVKGNNKGWLRTPLGGKGGMQYYLWWTNFGSQQAKNYDLPEKSILIREIRHHDTYDLLKVDEIKDYAPFKQVDLIDQDFFESPWTDDQLNFIQADDPVRIIIGQPGSGKTTGLWKAIETRNDQRVLYLTWSRNLSETARQHFSSFAPINLEVYNIDYLSFLGRICNTDIPRKRLIDNRRIFYEELGKLAHINLGPWKDKEKALFSEIRGYLFGHANPYSEKIIGDYVYRLSDEEYLNLRSGNDGIGKKAADTVVNIVSKIEKDPSLIDIFPELYYAKMAFNLLKDNKVIDEFVNFDRIVVDEIQDLTLIEYSVVLELCRAIYRKVGNAPYLLLAGDDGQTVRPTGFDWGLTKNLVGRKINIPVEFKLEWNLRCPSRIAEVINRLTDQYTYLEKGRRPTKQFHQIVSQHAQSYIFYINTNEKEAFELLRDLEPVEGVNLIYLEDNIPQWMPDDFRESLFTPAEVKGLEYQSIVLLNPGKLLASLSPTNSDYVEIEMSQQENRTRIDHLRVALSRATETLVFIDVNACEEEINLCLNLLGNITPLESNDVIEHFTDLDISLEEKISVRTKDSRDLLEERPKRAWQKICQAYELLGDPASDLSVSDPSVCGEVYDTLLQIGSRFIIEGTPEDVQRNDVINLSREVLKRSGWSDVRNAFEQLINWMDHRKYPPFKLLNALHSLGPQHYWLINSLVSVTVELQNSIEKSADDPVLAKEFSGKVEQWLIIAGSGGNEKENARTLRCKAAETLINNSNFPAAEKVVKLIKPDDFHLIGILHEEQGNYQEAANAFEKADEFENALRTWRKAGQWEKAEPHATGVLKNDLNWLIQFQKNMENQPPDLLPRLTENELSRMKTYLDQLDVEKVLQEKQRQSNIESARKQKKKNIFLNNQI